MCMADLAIYIQGRRRYSKAESLFEKALAILNEAVGPHHPLTAYTTANYADFLVHTHRASQAQSLLKQALHDLRTKLPPAHRYTKWARDVFKRVRAELHEDRKA